MESLWSKTAKIEERKVQNGDKYTDVAVIGAGLAGILTAYYLKKKGADVVVIEADRIGSGQTHKTTAKITSQHNLVYSRLIHTIGEEKAGHYAQYNEWAISEYEKLIESKGIACEFERCPSYLYSCLETEPLEEETKAALKLGIRAEYTRDAMLPFDIRGAVRFLDQARFHPLKFLGAIAEGLEIYERTKVLRAEDHIIITDRGSVKAEKIVFTTHFPFVNVPGYFFARMHQERSYVIALKNTPILDGNYLGIDSGGLSFRSCGHTLLLGGGNHRTGENRTGGQYKMLRSQAQKMWPQAREVSSWSAQDCMTLDGIPYIGKFADSAQNWYVATGFGKWGMTSSMVSARIISDMITGQKCPGAEVFSPQRHMTAKAAKTLMENGKVTFKSLGKRILSGAEAEAVDLAEGCGGIVEIMGEKAGAYKKDGKLYVVGVRCPHMGCQLEWNPEELTWECPCHGSRFDYKGRLIDNPAQEDLE